MRALPSLLLCTALASACGGSTSDLSCTGVAPQQLDQIWNVTFKAGGCSASGCHASGSRTATENLVWSSEHEFWQKATTLKAGEDPSRFYVKAGDLPGSYLYEKLVGPGHGSQSAQMPVGGPYFTSHQLDLVKGWICAGAPAPPSNL
jgi:hypothetical protein